MRKQNTFIAFVIILFIVFILASCASTEKLLQTKSKNEVYVIELRRFEKTQLHAKEWRMWSLGTIILTGIIITTIEE